MNYQKKTYIKYNIIIINHYHLVLLIKLNNNYLKPHIIHQLIVKLDNKVCIIHCWLKLN